MYKHLKVCKWIFHVWEQIKLSILKKDSDQDLRCSLNALSCSVFFRYSCLEIIGYVFLREMDRIRFSYFYVSQNKVKKGGFWVTRDEQLQIVAKMLFEKRTLKQPSPTPLLHPIFLPFFKYFSVWLMFLWKPIKVSIQKKLNEDHTPGFDSGKITIVQALSVWQKIWNLLWKKKYPSARNWT